MKGFLRNFLTVAVVIGLLGLAACNKANTVDTTADNTSLNNNPGNTTGADSGKPQVLGCASDTMKDELLCKLVPVEGEGGLEVFGWQSPKGILKHEFYEDGRLKQSTIFSDYKPNVTLMRTDLTYTSDGKIDTRKISIDHNADGQFETVNDTKFDYPDDTSYEEAGKQLNQMGLTRNIKNYYKISEIVTSAMDAQTGEAVTYKYKTTSIYHGIEGQFLSVTTNTLTTKNGVLDSAKTSFANCNLVTCDPNLKPPSQSSSLAFLQFDVVDGDLASFDTSIDINADGDFADPFDNTITCNIQYDEGNATPMAYFPEELKDLGLSGNKIPLSIECKGKLGNESHLNLTWQPLWQATGVAEPGPVAVK
jgi:hypothetical protein